MEFSIKVIVVVILLLIVALMIAVLIGGFGQQSGSLINDIIGFFRDLLGLNSPTPTP